MHNNQALDNDLASLLVRQKAKLDLEKAKIAEKKTAFSNSFGQS